MGDNIKIIEEWEKNISIFPKLNLDEAIVLYQKTKIETDNKKIELIKREVIQGTLYVVLNFIKNNGLANLNSSIYDINDIISVCNEIWIRKINSDSFLKIKKFNEIFDGEFYNLLNDGLGITKYSIAENTILTVAPATTIAILFGMLAFEKDLLSSDLSSSPSILTNPPKWN